MDKKNVAFICIHNSCRSQIAEALGKYYCSDKYNFYSAGTEIVKKIDVNVIRILKKIYNIDIEKDQYSKNIKEIPLPDIAISMGCDTECPYIGKDFDDYWNIKDPTGLDDIEYENIIHQIVQKILIM